MRWDLLIADLESQAVALGAREQYAEAVERTRREFARARLLDRLRSAIGQLVVVHPAQGEPLRGTLARLGAGWILISDGIGEQLVVTEHITSVSGLPGALDPPMTDAQRRVHDGLDLSYVLRGMSTDRSYLRLTLTGDQIAGTIDRVAADFFELAVHEPGEQRRGRAVREVRAVRTAAVVAMRRLDG